EVWADTRNLIQIRRQSVVPLTKSRYLGARVVLPRPDVVDCTWNYEAGSLRFVANLGTDDFETQTEGAHIIWSSDTGVPDVCLLPWTGIFLTKAA
ncbi:MAG TPA: DUF3459 domain-containing protein, partial [Methylobacterium sp.]